MDPGIFMMTHKVQILPRKGVYGHHVPFIASSLIPCDHFSNHTPLYHTRDM